MLRLISCCCLALVVCLTLAPCAAAGERTLVGWGVDSKHLDTFMPKAAAVGFDVIIAWSTSADYVARVIRAAEPVGIKVYACVGPATDRYGSWAPYKDKRPFPWQVMTEDEQAAARFIAAGKNRYMMQFQFGGEPVMTNEAYITPIVCFSDPLSVELLKPAVDRLAEVPGLKGIAFDGFGYQNYRRCHCPRCEKLLAAELARHPDEPAEQVINAFFRDLLVDHLNTLADYVRSRKATLKTSLHIWPVFAPEPLYGNRLDFDYCGQTAAWYMPWEPDKIARYSRIITGRAKAFHPRPEGVGMIGYYDRPGQFPVKDAQRVDLELRTMLDNGCRRVQVCGTRDVVANPEIAAVFRRYFGPDAP